MSATRRRLSRATRQSELSWRYLYNLRSTMLYRFRSPRLSGEAARVAADLDRDGIATSSIARLFPDTSLFDEMQREVAALGATPDARREKGFTRSLLGEDAIDLDLENCFARFAIAPPLLDIANAYFGMWTRLRYYGVWRTEVTEKEPSSSQLWHRDREDRLILKCFVYLNDVDEGTGPFTYARGTHPKGDPVVAPSQDENGVQRTTDEQMASVVPRDRWTVATGAAGTVIFADTRGYHKGGFARVRPRLMYNCMWTSPAAQSKEWLRYTDASRTEAPLEPVQTHAVRPRGKRFDWL